MPEKYGSFETFVNIHHEKRFTDDGNSDEDSLMGNVLASQDNDDGNHWKLLQDVMNVDYDEK